ncbi:hypothetical protein SSPO_073780 [Streptomyces antimycoticus]|uniref:Uncharacterized protein n=1 Tax=Streptomyces antimycoticus TaxID=68175 RepID=A0A499UVI2_9ACTN|nr:hypothetical protein SSPO_073780 [Streptomyces antimycoticus]
MEELSWAVGGRQLLLERRTVAVRSLGTACWALDFTSALTNVTGQELALGGAGHGGGFFWRVPRRPEPAQVFSAEGEGAAAVHGRPADWLALATDEWTLVFAGATGDTRADPWWVRTGEHPGVGSGLASDRPLPLAPADTVTRRIVTAITDGRLTPGTAARLAAQLSDRGRPYEQQVVGNRPSPATAGRCPLAGRAGTTDPHTASAPSPHGAPLNDQQPQANVTHKETNT